MTTITQDVTTIVGANDDTSWTFYSQQMRLSSSGTAIISTQKERKYPVAGILTVTLDPGPAVVIAADGKTYPFTVPATDSDLWSLLAGAVGMPPGTTQQAIAAAVTDYMNAHQIDEYHEYANLAAFPGTGVADRIYVALDTGKFYKWTGSAYAQIAGNAATALKLFTARNINGVAFDGTADITVADATKSPLLTTVTVLTANTAPPKFQSTSYDATAGALAVTLPALSGLTAGDWYGVQRYQLDVSTNAITLTPNGADTFDSGATSFSLPLTGELRYFQVVTVASVKKWKVVGGNTPLGSLDARYQGFDATVLTTATGRAVAFAIALG